ncbi:MAG TPA: YifB family Mg chelatase-like AAA ATPase [Nevskiaceae bacterium]|nr:YifB family Mg chelatase-like AAA ATPase [Nevskiaceae bacterium]
MSLATIHARALSGLVAEAVAVEVHLAPGLPGLSIVGLPEAAVREAKDRVRAAIQTCGYRVPPRRITINLAPADLPKEGGRFDLAIALGILVASGQLPAEPLQALEVLGELSLSGEIRPVRGALPAALAASREGRALLLPAANREEARLAPGAQVIAATHLAELCTALHGGPLPCEPPGAPPPATPRYPDLAEVRGQAQAKRALEIAAAGGHSLLMSGPPGAGKTLLAQRLPGLLPPLSEAEALEVAAVASVARGQFEAADWGRRPWRAPHHTASGVALVGGGPSPRPGEITLAHHGVLFLDELPEFSREVLEVLREPLESGQITISRAARQREFPARFQLVAAMNPCPCGYLGDSRQSCRCTPDQISRYRSRLSGPLLDRIDLHLSVPRVDSRQLTEASAPAGESSAQVRARVVAARERQRARNPLGVCNAWLDLAGLQALAPLAPAAQTLATQALERLGLSARGYHRVLKLARTIADLAGEEIIGSAALAEALRLRERPAEPG